MRRIIFLVTVAVVMTVSFVAMSPAAHAVIAIITPSEGLETAQSTPAIQERETFPGREAIDATGDAATEFKAPGYGTETALKR